MNSTDKELDKELDKLERIFTIDGEPYSVFDRDRLKALINRAVVAEFKLWNSKLEGLSATSFIKWRNEHETELKSKANN